MSYLKTTRNRLDHRQEPKPNIQGYSNPQSEHLAAREVDASKSPSVMDLERQLTKAYQHQTTRYETAFNVANQIATTLASDESAEDLQSQLGELMESISLADQKIAPMRERWDTGGHSANVELRRSVERLRSIIEKVIAAVGEAENIALEAKQRLEPHLSSAMSAKRMQAAYNAANTTK